MKSLSTFWGIALLMCSMNLNVHAQFSYIDAPSLPSSEINNRSALAVDTAGGVWVGFNKSFGYYNGSGWTMYNTATGAPFGRVANIVPAASGIWISARDSGIAVLNNNSWTTYNTQNSGLVNDSIQDLEVDGNSVWCATKNGLSLFNGTTWTNFTTANSLLLGNKITQISAVNGFVWIISDAGVNMYHTASQSWAGWPIISLPPIGTPTSILSLGNDVWIGGSAGTGYLNNGSFHSIKELTDGVDFSVIQLTPGRQGMPLVLKGSPGRALIQLNRNSVPEIIITNTISANTGASFVAFNQQNSNYYYVGMITDISPLPGVQVVAYGQSMTNLNSFVDFSNNRYLNINDANVSFLTRGDFGWNLSNGQFEVPKGSGTHCLFSSGLWIGGLDAGGQLHQAGMTYRQRGIDFFPGPLDTITAGTDSLVAYQYDYIWKINRADIEAFIYHFAQGNVQNGSFTPAGDILNWPAHGTGNYSRNLAPFVDVNNNGIYDPLAGGDYPKIKGDQMLYWIFNDNLAPHTETGGQPFGIEVHASAWAYACPALPDSQQVLNTTLFYSFELINRSSTTYSDVYAGLFQDYDLGSPFDDFVGSAPVYNTAFVYNGTPNDGGTPQAQIGTYGAHPPVFGLTVLDGPPADAFDGIDNDNDGIIDEANEKNLLSHFMYHNNDFTITGNPVNATHYYNYLSGYWLDGTPLTYGGNGYGGTTGATHIYSETPFATAQWNESSANNIPSDRRGISSTSVSALAPSASATITYAQIWSRDTTAVHGTPGYINFFLNDVQRVQNWYAAGSFPSCVTFTVGTGNDPQQLPDAKLYPNPGSDLVTLDYLPQTSNAQLQIIDLAGRVVQQEQLNAQPLNVFHAATLQPGVYQLRVTDGAQVIIFRFVRQ
ncbi:MAG: T9SS type A sorting domain-containing protein [Bacteroidetes bacterium]|nr:T9SS type A sorting domain-containing protein [Bacteroidota bacterium]